MIPQLDLILAFQKEWKTLGKAEWCETDFIKGIIQGLKIAKSLTIKMAADEKARLLANPHNWKCSHLKALATCLNYLKNGDRRSAMRTLDRALLRADKAEKFQRRAKAL